MATLKKSYLANGDSVRKGSIPLFCLVYKNGKLITVTDPDVIEDPRIKNEVLSILKYHVEKLSSLP